MVTEATTQTAALAADKRKEFTRSMIQMAGMVPVLVVICILFAFLTPNFLTQNNMVNVVRQASINIVLAAGMTFVILTGGIDLAVGSVLGFTAVIAVVVSLIPGLDWAAVPAALLAGALVGVLTGMTVAYIGLPPFIVTLGAMSILRGGVKGLAGEQKIDCDPRGIDSLLAPSSGVLLPAGVWIDTVHLESLPDREYRSGLAEVVKYGVILDADFFAF